MNRKIEKARVAKLSKRAQKLYERICNGHWYPSHSEKLPKAMKELFLAGLVKHAPRAVVIAKGIVPHDFKASYKESWGRVRRNIV